MPIEGEYVASPQKWVRDQVSKIEESGGTAGTGMRGMRVVVVTMRGAKTGKIRKVPLMRVEHDGVYALVASLGGAPKNPVWYYNLLADPRVDLQDGTAVHHDLKVREIHDEEYDTWWERAVAAFPDYADYKKRTARTIPLFVAEAA
jgi:F420H(2)-dependent quinone reductase